MRASLRLTNTIEWGEERGAGRGRRRQLVISCAILSILPVLGVASVRAAEAPAPYQPENCTACHTQAQDQMVRSVHAPIWPKQGEMDCLSCHRTHAEPGKASYGEIYQAANGPILHGTDLVTCGQCHQPAVHNYYDTYHGKHWALGKKLVPTCVTCHAGHELPLDDARSPLHPQNIGFTCAQCHGGDVGGKTLMTSALAGHWTGAVFYDKVAALRLPILVISWILFFAVLGCIGCVVLELRSLRQGWHGVKIPNARALTLQFLMFFALFAMLDQSGLALLYSEGRGDLLSELMNRLHTPVRANFSDPDTRSLIHRLAGGLLGLLVLGHLLAFVIWPRLWNGVRLRRGDRAGLKRALSSLRRRPTSGGLEAHAVPPWGPKLLYWAILPLATVMVLTGLYQWFMFGLMRSIGFTSVDIADLIHEGVGRALSVLSYFTLVIYLPARWWFVRRRPAV